MVGWCVVVKCQHAVWRRVPHGARVIWLSGGASMWQRTVALAARPNVNMEQSVGTLSRCIGPHFD